MCVATTFSYSTYDINMFLLQERILSKRYVHYSGMASFTNPVMPSRTVGYGIMAYFLHCEVQSLQQDRLFVLLNE